MGRHVAAACRAVSGRQALLSLVVALLVPVSTASAQPIPIIDVPFISQSEALCGGAAAAMVLRFWGAQGLTAESFAALVDRSAAGIRTTTLAADVERRGFTVAAVDGETGRIREWLGHGWPVIALVEDRPGTYHYVVVVAWHERGVIVHDPARAPFRVMPGAEFERRWSKANRWMMLALPADRDAPSTAAPTPSPFPSHALPGTADDSDATRCGQLIEAGVNYAQANDLAAAERSLTQALGCPGGAAARELAGVRLLQRRWPEVDALASAALEDNPSDTYAWKLLGTARFVDNALITALEAWNHAGEPTVDLFRVDGLTRTRQRIVERLIDIDAGQLLTPSRLRRAQRQVGELPSAASTAVTYVPAGNGLVQLRTVVAERSLFPRSAPAIVAVGVSAATRRELEAGIASFTGGGERLGVAWRFWPGRPRYAVRLDAPAPWGGVWSVAGSYEQQPFTDPRMIETRRETGEIGWAGWTTDRMRLSATGALDRWRERGAYGAVGAGLTVASRSDRVTVQADGRQWLGRESFTSGQLLATLRSSSQRSGTVAVIRGALAGVSIGAPSDLWTAGDTGNARPILLRAHPIVDDGRLRSERLGRFTSTVSVEAQRWRQVGPLGMAAALFVDTVHTAARFSGDPLTDVDAGAGLRISPPGMPGMLRVDFAKGLRDGSTAFSLVYER